jgi:hypothetical protein
MGFDLFEHGYHLFSLNPREIIKKVIDSMAALKVVNQCLKRHARSDKDGRAAEVSGSEWTTVRMSKL